MDLEQALEYAIDGHSVLFCGAGFSRGAVNLRGTALKTGQELARHLATEKGYSLDTGLADAADEYLSLYGEDSLISELQQEFTVGEISADHALIVRIPWKRIYTTNYDNVLEVAHARNGNRLTSVTLDDNPRDTSKESPLCIHFNGFVDRLTRYTISSGVKLTDTAYLTSSVSDSLWAVMFRQDLASARSVFFVGYSLADLDISRLLYEAPALKEKCFFILGKSPGAAVVRRASRFGTPQEIDTNEFASLVDQKLQTYVPQDEQVFLTHCLQRFEPPQPSVVFSDQDVLDLLLLGQARIELVWESLHDGHRYFLQRNISNYVFDNLAKRRARVAVVHSELGNGKTMFLEGVKCHAWESGYAVYTAVTQTPDIHAELEHVMSKSGQTLIVIDDYPSWLDVIEHIALNAPDRLLMLLSARNVIHDVMIDRLCEIVNLDSIPEISLDRLGNDEITWLVRFFDEYGLWGQQAGWSERRKWEYLHRQCQSEFSAALIKILASPQIQTRFDKILEELHNKRGFYEVAISIMVLTVLNISPTMNHLVDLWGDRVLQSQFRRNPAIQQIIDFGQGTLRLRSAVAAQFILQRMADANVIVDVLTKMAKAADKASSVSEYHHRLFIDLVRYSSLQNVLPEQQKRPAIIRYYESLKNLEQCKRYPLFWLQYAIACLVIGEYDRAGRYFETAYSLANTRSFDTYQIDNHYARYLLLSAIESRDASKAMPAFRRARKIINDEIKRERLHYPYRVAKLYVDFYDTFSATLKNSEKNEIAAAATFVLHRINTLPDERRRQRYVAECQDALQYILGSVAIEDSSNSVD